MDQSGRLRPTWAEIDLSAIRDNTKTLVGLARSKGLDLLGVVKADAYGHGAVECSRVVLAGGATGLAVAIPEEGIALRRASIGGQILVMGAYAPGTARAFVEHGLDATVSSLEEAGALRRDVEALGADGAAVHRVQVHLKVDTGMGRLGVRPEEALALATLTADHPGIRLKGVYTHLATADEQDRAFAEEQLARFESVLKTLRAGGVRPPQTHALNSGGLLQHDPGTSNTCRIGIALYGFAPSGHLKGVAPLRPALSWKTRVAAVKRAAKGETVSYGRRYRTDRDTTLAVLPVGYADGFTRLLSQRVTVLIHGRRYPVVGSICMDQAVVDVGDDPITPGDEVVLLGRQGKEVASADEWAELLGTIHYEVVSRISSRVPRVYEGGVSDPPRRSAEREETE